MYSIEIYLQGSQKYCEVCPNDLETIELMVENLVSRVLLELFQAMAVKGVVVRFLPREHEPDEVLTLL